MELIEVTVHISAMWGRSPWLDIAAQIADAIEESGEFHDVSVVIVPDGAED